MLQIPGFLFPAVDLAWKEEKAKNLQEIQSKSVCIAGDGQSDSSGHNAKYCFLRDGLCLRKSYQFLRNCNVPSARHLMLWKNWGFSTVMDRMINDGVKIEMIKRQQLRRFKYQTETAPLPLLYD